MEPQEKEEYQSDYVADRHCMICAVSNKYWMEGRLLKLDVDTGRCCLVILAGAGEYLKLCWFTGDWLLGWGNGEILSDDFVQVDQYDHPEGTAYPSVGCLAVKNEHIGILTDGAMVIATQRATGPAFHYSAGFGEFLPAVSRLRNIGTMAGKQGGVPGFVKRPKAADQKTIQK